MKTSFKLEEKDKLHQHHYRFLAPIFWLLVPIVIISALASLVFLRQNYLTMIDLRNDVIEADEKGEGIEEALENLGNHVVAHMNTSMASPIELPNSFNRDYDAMVEKSEKLTNKQYLKIREKCVNFIDEVAVQSQCIRDEANKIGEVDIYLPTELYSFNFKSPVWRADSAGLSILVTTVGALIIAMRLIADFIAKNILKEH